MFNNFKIVKVTDLGKAFLIRFSPPIGDQPSLFIDAESIELPTEFGSVKPIELSSAAIKKHANPLINKLQEYL